MAQADRPLSVEEIFDTGKQQMPALGIATVYRSLRSFKDEGFIHEVDLPGRASRWEMAGKAHHHHFLCDKCNKLFEVEGCPADIRSLLPQGYTLEQHDILLQGQCVDCAGIKNKTK
jgi:Fur family ferric uptake transcriptional regulator